MIELVDIRSRVVTVLQDIGYIRWTKTELNNYIHDSVLDLVRTIRLPVEDKDVVISATNYQITLPSTLMDISGGSIKGRELPIVTTSNAIWPGIRRIPLSLFFPNIKGLPCSHTICLSLATLLSAK